MPVHCPSIAGHDWPRCTRIPGADIPVADGSHGLPVSGIRLAAHFLQLRKLNARIALQQAQGIAPHDTRMLLRIAGKDHARPLLFRQVEYVPLHALLSEPLREWHRQSPHARGKDFVFPSLLADGKVPLNACSFVKDHLRPAAQGVGVQIADGQRFGLHNLRHSLSNWLVNKGKVEPLLFYRERVYAYELYHQLRTIWPEHWRYSLAGEVDILPGRS